MECKELSKANVSHFGFGIPWNSEHAGFPGTAVMANEDMERIMEAQQMPANHFAKY